MGKASVQGNITILEKHFQELANHRDKIEQHTLQGEWKGAEEYIASIAESVQAAHADLQAGHALLKSYQGFAEAALSRAPVKSEESQP